MPKMKTHKGAAKRFKKTKNGKFKYKAASHRHLLVNKSKKSKRKAGKMQVVHDADHARIAPLLQFA